jgi:hypothetical protein
MGFDKQIGLTFEGGWGIVSAANGAPAVDYWSTLR